MSADDPQPAEPAAEGHGARRPGRTGIGRVGVGAAIVLVLVAAAVTVLIGVIRTTALPTEAVTPAASGAVSAEAAAVYVHVHGAVAEPGLYRLETGDRVVDVVAAAGGFTDAADRGAINLARAVADGEQIIVPEAGAGAAAADGSGAPGAAPPASDGVIDLNAADATALETLPRVGPALAERIIAWRTENGRFTSIEDLLAVPGIGDKMLEALRDLVRV